MLKFDKVVVFFWEEARYDKTQEENNIDKVTLIEVLQWLDNHILSSLTTM